MNIEANIKHFNRAAGALIVKAYDAIRQNDTTAFHEIMEKVKNSGLVASLAASISSSRIAADNFCARMQKLGPIGKVIVGLTTVVAGAMLWTSAGALSTVIGFALIALGISIALPAAWQWVSNQMDEFVRI